MMMMMVMKMKVMRMMMMMGRIVAERSAANLSISSEMHPLLSATSCSQMTMTMMKQVKEEEIEVVL